MRRFVRTACWAALVLVMIYPYKHLGFFDLSSNGLQAALFGASMVMWAFVQTRRRGLSKAEVRGAIVSKLLVGGGVLLAVAGGSEILQAFLPDRDARLRDFELNSAAIIVVALLCYGLAMVIFSQAKTAEDEHAEIYGFRPPKL